MNQPSHKRFRDFATSVTDRVFHDQLPDSDKAWFYSHGFLYASHWGSQDIEAKGGMSLYKIGVTTRPKERVQEFQANERYKGFTEFIWHGPVFTLLPLEETLLRDFGIDNLHNEDLIYSNLPEMFRFILPFLVAVSEFGLLFPMTNHEVTSLPKLQSLAKNSIALRL
jgi:hypothetical protein